MTDPVLVDLDHLDDMLHAVAKTLEVRLRIFLIAFVPALLVALTAAGPRPSWPALWGILGSATVAGLNELDPAIPWSMIGRAIRDMYRDPTSAPPRNGGPT